MNSLALLDDLQASLSSEAAAILLKLRPGIDGPDVALKLARLGHLFATRGLRADAAQVCIRVASHFPQDLHAATQARRVLKAGIPTWHVPMLLDEARAAAYSRRIAQVVRPGMVVLDIGTGSGLLAMMAARAGAALVIACEQHPALAAIAEENVRRNGLSDRVKVLAKRSTALDPRSDLPRPADLLISEIVDSQIVGEGVLATVADARRRLLAPHALAIPEAGTIHVALGRAVLDQPTLPRVDSFDIAAIDHLRPVLKVAKGTDVHLVTPIQNLFCFDLSGRDFPHTGRAEVDLTVEHPGSDLKLLQWMSLDLGGNVSLTSGPGSPVTSWRIVSPRVERSLDLSAGDSVRVRGEYGSEAVMAWIASN